MADLPDLRTSLGAAPLEADVVRVHGPEAIEYLQGQLSQDVSGLPIGAAAPSLLLQPAGKVEAWLRVVRLGEDDALLVVGAGFGEAVHARLRRFKLRTKVELELERWTGLAVRGPGSEAIEAPLGALRLAAGWPGVEGVDLLAADGVALEGVAMVDPAAIDALRIEAGVPAMGADLSEATIPAEAGQWLIDASVSFTKGCYTGQELVARVDSRGGNVPRPLRGLLVAGDDPVPVGAELQLDGKAVGTVTSSGRSPALGPIALAVVGRAVGPGEVVTVVSPGGPVEATIAELPLR